MVSGGGHIPETKSDEFLRYTDIFLLDTERKRWYNWQTTGRKNEKLTKIRRRANGEA